MPEAVDQPAVHSDFVSRLASLPAVMSAVDTAKQSYNLVKDKNGLLNYTLTTAERSASFAMDQSKPLLQKLAGPIQYVDGLACKGLDKIEESYPVVKDPPQKIVADAATFGRKKYDDAREYGVAKLDSLKQYSSQTLHVLSHPGETLLTAYAAYSDKVSTFAHNALEAVEEGLTKHIHELGVSADSSTANHQESQDLRARIGSVSSKAKICLEGHARQQLLYFNGSVAKLQQALDLVRQMKERLFSKDKSFQEVLHDLSENSVWLQAVLADPDPGAEKTLPHQAYVVANNLLHMTTATIANQFPVVHRIQDNILDSSSRLASGVSVLIQKYRPHTDVNELANATVNRLKAQAEHIHKVTVQAADFAFSFLVSIPVLDRFASQPPSPSKDYPPPASEDRDPASDGSSSE